MNGCSIKVLASIIGLTFTLGTAARDVHVDNTYSYDGRRFHWTVFVAEPFSLLRQIKCVEYTLHPAFRDRVRLQCDSETGFALQEVGQDEFTLLLNIQWRDGHVTSQSYVINLHAGAKQSLRLDTPPVHLIDPLLSKLKPVAILTDSASMMVVDQYSSRILRMNLADHTLKVTEAFRLASTAVLNDAVLAYDEGRPIVIVSSVLGSTGELEAYPKIGNTTAGIFWSGADLKFGWLAADSQEGTVYAISTQEPPEMYEINPGAHRLNPKYLLDLPSPLDIWLHQPSISGGPVTCLRRKELLFLSLAGTLYQVDLSTKRIKPITIARGSRIRALSTPRGLAADSTGETAYAADGGHLRTITFGSEGARILPFGPDHLFESISALAIDNEGRVWAGDDYKHRIFVLSPQGTLLLDLSGR